MVEEILNHNEESFGGEIVVSSKIIDYLSSGLYHSPAACLKELINNSFDADASEVNIYIKPDADRIIIEDNGEGMSREEFEKNFKRISESHKRDSSDHTPSGRPKIGKIGIGFIAANEICEVMEIISHKKASDKQLEVSINFELMRKGVDERERDRGDIAKADYQGRVVDTDAELSYTRVFLKNIRGEAKSILSGAGTSRFASGGKSLYGLKPESEFSILKDRDIKTWSEFDAYSKNKLEIGLNVPVKYHDNWLPEKLKNELLDLKEHVDKLGFTVYLDGSEIRKPILFNPTGRALISRFNFSGEYVSAKGYFYAQNSSIRPDELHGLLVRIRNAAVGDYDPSFLGFSLTYGPLFQNWISGEIIADDRLEDAMNIDRRTLRISHPAYVELQKEVHNHLEELIKRMRKEIYGAGSDERNESRAQIIKSKIMALANYEITQISPEAAEYISSLWEDALEDKSGQKRLLKKYSVDQLYSIVLEVASESMSNEQFQQFVKLLTEKLR